jgi:hypothetical protein
MVDERMDRISEGGGLAHGDNSSQNVDNDFSKNEVAAPFVIGDDESSEKQYENFDDNVPDGKQTSAD